MSLRKLALVALLAFGILVIPATSGVSSVSVDRGAIGKIAPDGSAYLGFEQETSNINENTSTADLDVTITNQLGSADDLTVTVNGREKVIGSGESKDYTFYDIECGSTIDVKASGSGVKIEFDREVKC